MRVSDGNARYVVFVARNGYRRIYKFVFVRYHGHGSRRQIRFPDVYISQRHFAVSSVECQVLYTA